LQVLEESERVSFVSVAKSFVVAKYSRIEIERTEDHI